MGVLKLFEGTNELVCVVVTIRTPDGSLQKVVDGTSFSIGRAPDCVLSIPHAGISRLHVLVTIKRGEVYLMDQESSNGTFINGTKVEPKRLIHIKPSDEIKLGLSEVFMQFAALEKHFKVDYIAESLLPSHEKDNLQALIRASNHKAQEIISGAQIQADHISQVSAEKARNLENQTLLKQEEIISSAQVEGQHLVSESKRKAAQILLENEDRTKESCQNIYDQAERIRKEAETYFQNRVKEAETAGAEIIDHHAKLGQELVEDLKEKTTKKVEAEIRLQLATIISEIEEKTNYFKELQETCSDFELNRKNEIEAELNKLKDDLKAQFDLEKVEKFDSLQLKIKNLENEYEQKNIQFEKDYLTKAAHLDRDLNEKKSIFEKDYLNRTLEMENSFAEKSTLLEDKYLQKTFDLENKYENRKAEIDEELKLKIEEASVSLVKQKQRLDSEIQIQRQELSQVASELNLANEKCIEAKNQFDNIKELLTGLQKNEADLIKSLGEKRDLIKRADFDLLEIKKEIDTQNEKFISQKNGLESQIDECQHRLSKLKAAFEAESERLKKESEIELLAYKEEFKREKNLLDQQLKNEKSDIHKKTADYMDSERLRLEDYRTQLLQEKKNLDLAFDKTKKDFELKTKEVIELEKQKIEEARQSFVLNLNRERQLITDEVTIAIMKIKNRDSLTASHISDEVARVFNSHVTSHSVDSTIKNSTNNQNRLKVQFMGYGLGLALVGLFAFKVLIQPQINRHIAGTEEHAMAAIPVERPKYVAPQSLDYKDTYTDAVLYTQKFAEIYLDEQLHDKWFKHISGYMYENWRVDETKSIEAISISKTLVQNLKDTSLNLDSEFYQKGIEKMRELEMSHEKRIMDILGTKVKYEAFKRKEREFFEPYIQNQ